MGGDCDGLWPSSTWRVIAAATAVVASGVFWFYVLFRLFVHVGFGLGQIVAVALGVAAALVVAIRTIAIVIVSVIVIE